MQCTDYMDQELRITQDKKIMLFLEWGYIFYNLCSRAQENNSQKINFDTRSHKKYVENNIRISESLFFDEQIST